MRRWSGRRTPGGIETFMDPAPLLRPAAFEQKWAASPRLCYANKPKLTQKKSRWGAYPSRCCLEAPLCRDLVALRLFSGAGDGAPANANKITPPLNVSSSTAVAPISAAHVVLGAPGDVGVVKELHAIAWVGWRYKFAALNQKSPHRTADLDHS